MSAGALAARLDRRFELLTGPESGPARQRTLRATIDWSFDLLSAEARTLFGALSVFRGGWTLDTAELVTVAAGVRRDAVAPLIAELAEQSMIRVQLPAEGAARYRMLETMRAYATAWLAETGRQGAVAERHAEHFIALAERAVPHRRGPLEPAWVSELAVEFDNLRAAYQWAVGCGRYADALRLVEALADDVMMRERLEIGRWAEGLGARPEVHREPGRAFALALASNTAMLEDRLDDALRLALDALEAERRTAAPPCWISRNTLALLSAAGSTQGRVDGAWHEHLDAIVAISRGAADPFPAAVADYERVLIYSLAGVPVMGADAAAALLEVGTERGNPSMMAMGLLAQGRTVADDDPARASRLYRDGLAAASSTHNTLLVQHALRAVEELNARSGDRTAALAALRAVAGRFERSGNVSEQLQTVITMLDSLVAVGAFVPAATICGALARTPWRQTATCRLVDRIVAEHLERDQYVAARRAGAVMPPADLVSYATACVKEVAGEV
jgi:hypothetical protein